MTRELPWNSMELLAATKLTHSKFHGTPWNSFCPWNWPNSSLHQRNWRTPNSIKLLGSTKLAHLNFHGIPSNSRQLQNIHFDDKISCMEFYGTACVNDIGALQVPWHFVEIKLDNMLTTKLYRDTQNSCTRDNTWNTGKLEGNEYN